MWHAGAQSSALHHILLPIKLPSHSRSFQFSQTSCRAVSQQRSQAVDALLVAVQDSERGLLTSRAKRKEVDAAVNSLTDLGKDQVTTTRDIDATWRLLWTTEKETLFIIKYAKLFGTKAGDVYQVIDTAKGKLQNVITFNNGASFVVDSSLAKGGDKRLIFKFTGATLNLSSRAWNLPPFGQGWFDTVYLDKDIRVAKDIRGDTLVVQREGAPRTFP